MVRTPLIDQTESVFPPTSSEPAATARALSLASAAAYSHHLYPATYGADAAQVFTYGSQLAVLLVGPCDLVVAFCGTDELADWLVNLRCLPITLLSGKHGRCTKSACRVGYTAEEGLASRTLTFLKPGVDFGGHVHAGFQYAVMGLLPQVYQGLLRWHEPGRRIWLTGHSLGGALATLAATYLFEAGVELSGVYTFGAPRVGNKTWALYYDLFLGAMTYHYIHGADPVPWLPSKLFGYDRQPCAKWFDGDAWQDSVPWCRWLRTFLVGRRHLLSGLADHGLSRYRKALAR